MRMLRSFFARFMALFGSERRDRELADEIESHLQFHAQDNLGSGMSPAEARRQAVLKLGGVEQTKEMYRRQRGLPMIETLLQDLRFSVRMFRKDARFSLLVILILALGVGANSSIFSVVNAILLRPLPYPQSDRLVYLEESNPQKGWPRFSASPANFLDWRAQSRSFEQVVSFAEDTSNVILDGLPEHWTGTAATQGFFELLRVRPALGRPFTDDDFLAGKNHVLILSDALWRANFAADRGVLGRSIPMDGHPYTIIGVMPAGFRFHGDQIRYWVPFDLDSSLATVRGAHFIRVIARLRDGVTIPQAQAEMTGIAAHLEKQYPDTNAGWTVAVDSMQDSLVQNVHSALLVLLGAVGFVLLIACANAANLLLSRASVRRREIAIRMALGAGRRRIVRQLLTESVVLALAGGALGLAIAYVSSRALRALPSSLLPSAAAIHVDIRVLMFTLGLSVVTGVLFGLSPAVLTSRESLVETIKESGSTGRGGRAGLTRALVVVEIALAMILLISSGLLVRSFAKLSAMSPGVATAGRLTFEVNLPRARYSNPAQWTEFYQEARRGLQALPGVESVTMTSLVPVSGEESVWSFGINGQPNSSSLPSAEYYLVTPNYLREMGIPLLAGRDFMEQDTASSPHVCLINDFLARTIFHGQNPIGQRLQLGRDYSIVHEIVGVVASVKQRSLQDKDSFQVYEPFEQLPRAGMTFILRTAGSAANLVPGVRHAIQQVDSQQPITAPRTMDDIVHESVALPRFRTLLLSLFSGLALLLALVGLYSVMSYAVQQQFQEIGVRIVLGALPGDIYRFVLRRGTSLVFVGIGIGLAGTIVMSQLLRAFLFEVTPHDPVTIASVVLLFTVVAMLACALPARRATRVDPMSALRHE
ncbi:MAG TPA: ABC transporter permease [Candidatus Binatus sp.]|jgi:predicted permease|nr:ABC transporter permease [Candidatus Binatus sp.]